MNYIDLFGFYRNYIQKMIYISKKDLHIDLFDFKSMHMNLYKGQTQCIEAPTQGGVWGGIIGT